MPGVFFWLPYGATQVPHISHPFRVRGTRNA
jgi:hypothetical protein